MTDPQRIIDQAYRVAIEERIVELLRYRRWYRQHAFTITWPTRHENEAELRALVRIARKARAMSRRHVERHDPITLAQYRDWTAGEFMYGFGK